jgi:hypothetical protein
MQTRHSGLAIGSLDNAGYFIRIEWLGEHIVATQVQHLGPERFVGEWGCNDHAQGLIASGCKREKFAPALIGNNDGAVELIEKRGGLSVISGLINGIPTGCEYRREQSPRLLAR